MSKEKTYDDAAIQERLAALPHWRHADGALQRTYKTSGWRATLMVVTTIGHLCEAGWHHPDLAVSYDSVTVKLSTPFRQGDHRQGFRDGSQDRGRRRLAAGQGGWRADWAAGE